jgi:uncharacterized protein YecE (DUF72 family)
VIPIAGTDPTTRSLPSPGPFTYYRFHQGAHGAGIGDDELRFWAARRVHQAAASRAVYAYFNDDPDGHAVTDANRLRARLKGKVSLAR